MKFDVGVAFLLGVNAANNNLILEGFREWLIPKLGHGSNLPWSELVLYLVFPDADFPRHCLKQQTDEKNAFDVLFKLLQEFWQERESSYGLRWIYLKYQKWVSKQEWYFPGSPDWFEF